MAWRSTAAKSRDAAGDVEEAKVVRASRSLETRNFTISPSWKESQAAEES